MKVKDPSPVVPYDWYHKEDGCMLMYEKGYLLYIREYSKDILTATVKMNSFLFHEEKLCLWFPIEV